MLRFAEPHGARLPYSEVGLNGAAPSKQRKVRLQRPGLFGSCPSWDTCEPSNSAADLSHRSARCWSTAFRCGSLARSANSEQRKARSALLRVHAYRPTRASRTDCLLRAPARDRQSRGPAASEGPSPPPHPLGRSSSCGARDVLKGCYFLDETIGRAIKKKPRPRPGLKSTRESSPQRLSDGWTI